MCEQVAQSYYILQNSLESNLQPVNLKSSATLVVFCQ